MFAHCKEHHRLKKKLYVNFGKKGIQTKQTIEKTVKYQNILKHLSSFSGEVYVNCVPLARR